MKGSEYKDTLTKILGETKGTAYGNLLLKETLIKLDPEFAKATAGVKDYDTRLLLLEAALLGVAIAEALGVGVAEALGVVVVVGVGVIN